MKIPFEKMHGLGNDFVFVTDLKGELSSLPELSRRLCGRRTGIGADGLVLVKAASKGGDLRMQIINSDGSEAQMCGNASRCFVLYAQKHGLIRGPELKMETLSGIKEARLLPDGRVRVCMGDIDEGDICAHEAKLPGGAVEYWPVNTGVPHAVVYVDEPEQRAWMDVGAAMEWAREFPQGTNCDFIRVDDRENITMRVWERGCGETLCCGTGATASALVSMKRGLVDSGVSVHLKLGALTIEKINGLAYMTGPAESVFEGEIEI